MTRTRYKLALLIAFANTAEASAQIVVGLPIAVQNGIDFRYQSGGLRVRGVFPTGGFYSPGYLAPAPYYPYGPYGRYYPGYPLTMGVVDQRVIVRVMPPPIVVMRRAEPDLAGIDLDVESASKIWGEKPSLAKKDDRIVPPIEKKPPPEAAKPPKPPVKPEPMPEGQRLAKLGADAFQAGEYNLAIRRFRQLGELAPVVARPLFLEGQALIAVGKYRDAVEIIEQGLKRLPDWPSSVFRPKADLYDNDVAVWTEHRKQLEEAHRLNPTNADYHFLLGYLAWFDGERDIAVEHFTQARNLAADARFSDLFLKVAKK